MDKFSDMLTCHLCFERFDNKNKMPKSLPCVHSFCIPCLDNFLQKNLADRLPCPFCRELFERPENGVDSLPTNFYITQLREGLAGVNVSQNSEGDATDVQCAVHANKKAVIVCMDCNICLCGKCVTTQEHGQHELLDAEDAFQEIQTKLAGLESKLNMLNIDVTNFKMHTDLKIKAKVEELKEQQVKIHEKCDLLSENIKSTADKLKTCTKLDSIQLVVDLEKETEKLVESKELLSTEEISDIQLQGNNSFGNVRKLDVETICTLKYKFF